MKRARCMSQVGLLPMLAASLVLFAGIMLPPFLSAQTALPGTLRSVVYHNAPFWIQEVKLPLDQIWPVDFDGDLDASNNHDEFDGIILPPVVNSTPKIYYSIVETGYGPDDGYYLLGYYHYHYRDGGFRFGLWGSNGHTNDMEGVWIALKKSSYWPYGKKVVTLTEAHGALIPSFSDITYPTPPWPDGGWETPLHNWMDMRYRYERPVFGIRAFTHGTYVAPDCSGQSGDLLEGVGMWRFSVENYNEFRFCVHGDVAGAIIYYPQLEESLVPSSGLPVPQQLPLDQTSGLALYSLEELSQSVLWQNRATPGLLFAGSPVTLAGGFTALPFFNDPNGAAEANPPWAWLGGPGEGISSLGQYWYTWGEDGTSDQFQAHRDFAYTTPGALLGGAADELRHRFPFLEDLNQPVRYNPYITQQPDYNNYNAPLSASISGPTFLNAGETGTWTATVGGGSGSYTYQWSGALTGAGASITGSPSAAGDLYLDVWDSAGRHIAIGYWVDVSQTCGNSTGDFGC